MSPPGHRRTVAFALGANLGEPLGALRAAAATLARSLEHPRVSAVYRTPPEGGAPQPPYLNAVLVGDATLEPAEALALAHQVERDAGRERTVPGASRTLDVDVLFVGDTVVETPALRIPHPRWRGRPFVVIPLLDVAPGLKDPESGDTVREVARAAGWRRQGFPVVLAAGALLEPWEGA